MILTWHRAASDKRIFAASSSSIPRHTASHGGEIRRSVSPVRPPARWRERNAVSRRCCFHCWFRVPVSALAAKRDARSLLNLVLIRNYHRASERTNNMPVVARTIRSHAVAALANGMHAEKPQLSWYNVIALTRSNERLPAQSIRFFAEETGAAASCGCTFASGCHNEYGSVAVRRISKQYHCTWYLHSRCFLHTYKLQVLALHTRWQNTIDLYLHLIMNSNFKINKIFN